MKKTMALVLAGALLLAGCGAKQEQPVPQLEVPETITAVKPMPDPLILRYVDQVREEHGKERLYLTMSHRMPKVFLPGSPEVSQLLNQAITESDQAYFKGDPKNENFGRGFDAYALESQQLFKEDPVPYGPMTVAKNTELTQISEVLLSWVSTESIGRGGPYASQHTESFVYDLRTGARLTLEDLALEPEALRNYLAAAIVEQAMNSPEIQGSIAWYAPDEYEEVLPGLIREGSWSVTRDGIQISSQEEELGPHAAGTVSFVVSFNRLQDLLKPEYLPGPLEKAKGTLTVAAPEGCNARIIDDLVLDDQGQTILISVRGRVRNVTVSGSQYLGEEGFIMSWPIWQASFLEDCALRLQAVLPDAAPNLMVSYEDQEGLHSYLLAQSGKDGSYFLMDP